MPRSRSTVALLALLLAAVIANGQTDPVLWRFLQPNAKALIGIDWGRIGPSHVGTILREKFVNTNGASIPGIEFLNDIDRVLISSPGKDPGDDTSEPPILIVVRGHFDTAKVRQALVRHGAKPQIFNSIQVYRPQEKGKDMAFVVLDAQTILIGDARSVFASLERAKSTAQPTEMSSLMTRAAQMDANYEFWALMTGTGALASNRLMDLFSGGAPDNDPLGFEAGVSLRSGLAADINLMFPTEAAAKRQATELTRLLKLAIKDKVGEPAMLDLEKKLKIASDGSLAKVSLRLNPQELEKNAQLFAASHKPPPAGVVATAKPVAVPEPIPPPKPEKSVIKIEGLDEGTREIPYKPDRPLP